jgi:hypothetical protein
VGQVDLAELAATLAARSTPRSEADVQAGIQSLLLYGGLNLDDPLVRLETPAPGRRRVDIETGLTVIECKKDLSVGNVRAEAVEQLAGYVRDRTNELAQRYAGILTDGQEWSLYHLNQASGELRPVSTFTVQATAPDVDGLLVWLEGVLSTAEQLVPTPREVQRRLGSDSPGFELDLAELLDIYEQCRAAPEVRQKRELWSRLLAAAFGRNFDNDDKLFIAHTYLVLTAGVIAHAVLGFDLRSGAISARDLVSGAEFRRASIAGVVEADFFDWPVESPQGESFVDGLARRLARFAWKEVEHDVLKVLYESVIDPATRHSLGEYYTPDWLAERIVGEVVDDPLAQRTLDPACGSGTFLFWAVRRYLQAADTAAHPNREAVSGVTAHVFGVDLHPVAVTLARVTYLLAIGNERLHDRDSLSIPVYLGDSIQLNQATSVLSTAGVTIHTTDGLEFFARELNFPESVVADASRFDPLVDELATKAARRLADGKPPAIAQTMTNFGITHDVDRAMIESTYQVLCHLHDSHRDHIWGYYVRNLARPLEFTRAAHRVDRLVGNPPWLRYNAMTATTQEQFRRLTRERNLQAPAQVVTSQDLSALFVARTIDLYLRLGGRFGFVMPAAALSRLQYRGFRAADYSTQAATAFVAFAQPWELTEVRPQPFPVPASVVFGARVDAGELVAMPPTATWWKANVPDHYRSWEAVGPLFSSDEREVVVITGEFNSPYADLVRQGSNRVPRVLLAVREHEAGPLHLAAGRVAVESARLGGEKPPWRDLRTQQGEVEAQFLMPILIGDSLLPFCRRGDVRAVIPWDGTELLAGSREEIEAYPGLAAWWRNAERLFIRHRSETTTLDLIGQIDYQSKLTTQFPLGEHRIAYTGRGEIVTAARVSDPDAVIDHALYWAAFDSADEALYVVGVINTRAVHSRIVDALSKGLFGGRNIHRAPFLIAWPQFDPRDELHIDIAAVAGDAETIAAAAGHAGGIVAARNRVRSALEGDGVAARLETLVEELLARAGADEAIEAGAGDAAA